MRRIAPVLLLLAAGCSQETGTVPKFEERPSIEPRLQAEMMEVDAAPAVQMVQIGSFSVNQSLVERGTCPSGEAGMRRQVREVTFKPVFAKPPTVALTVASLDTPGNGGDARNVRYSVYAKGVTAGGATIVIETWCDTNIYQLTGNIIAVGNR